ncbi:MULTISPECIES: DNA gyrase/topoisomerase IV subunit A [Streptomyces]|uniref:DNA topoisomerase (ATP-hydrolyzing) n=1 Tax=Streptomyces tsukubensis (strain DSM 42081 / NBRC 108919 / NRRL 18488 / 9993) TaxID=1114943 RepID=I2N7K3_STRT9|nr:MULTISPECIES: DNA topoisomerase IV subunit A [Streptomyces]AZK96924.1 DNA topoisomerase IV [Streptomyces tsukubensis]EIF93000.1 DNA topoisomerase IV subunit A [Streptomyces tsukubensis NRRL18488]MYS66607.1 DNA topoisomerase 4 subunit A [Streptomyces sp. SID5473]QKM67092.1 DNA topoisomerase IV subunit A [Streptomyces tsukubensis NRRL18488]TAI41427.1 DNA topoisomerase IV subunit A [Streptomyces tsukubensis]
MARRSTKTPPPDDFEERILDIDVVDEMQGSFLEYAYSVIYSRALPDARDGMKPVQRRIVYQMNEMGLRPDRGYVKCARVVGEVMGRLHPHGDQSIYDALVRMAQPFSMRLPLVDGHGNFGSLGNDDPPAAMRYTECRMADATSLMTESIDEDTVDFAPNYDGQEQEPVALPAAYPNLLVNGASGIAVGMATNMPPHNLGEVVAAARHLIRHPGADLETLMRYVPGPDLPTGGRIVGLAGIRDAYETGRGTFKIRATVTVEDVTPRRKGLVVTELPFTVGPEKVIAKIKDLVGAKRLQGIADVKDLTDRAHGLRLVIEVKNGFVPEAVLEQLYKLTPMEESFGINNVALVDGQPLTLGLKELLEVYLDHRFTVVRRRSEFRRSKRRDRLHLVEGLLTALVDIDEVIRLIRSSENSAQAKERLMARFSLSETQTQYILDTPLRRLTKFDRIELESERDRLTAEIDELTAILESDAELRKLVSAELAAVGKKYATERRTVLLESGAVPVAAVPLEVADDPCRVLLSSTGLLARTASGDPLPEPAEKRARHDLIVSSVAATARGDIGVVTSAGRLLRLAVIDLPQLPQTVSAPNLSGGAQLSEFLSLETDETVVCLTTLAEDSPGLALGTVQGVVKRVVPDYPANKDELEVMALKDGDRIVGGSELRTGEEDLVFITSDAQLLRFQASQVRPQGRAAGGMAGIKLGQGAVVLSFAAVDPAADAVVFTAAGSTGALDDSVTTVKLTPFDQYPRKGRATGGVRCQRFLKGEDVLLLAWAGGAPARAAQQNGTPAALPDPDPRRDGSGTPPVSSVAVLAGPAL